jgi:uncharacterized protein
VTVEYEVLRAAPLDPRAEQTMVRMRDGIHLATDIYLPEGHSRAPAVLVRLPYDKNGRYTFMTRFAPYVNERGYAFVVQDVRGKFRSEGETMPFVHEVEDGYDTLDWIAAQPWSDGRVGMWGDSYYGFTQWAAAASGHPALKAIVPRVTSTDFRVSNWWGEKVVMLYSAQYLTECWLDQWMYHIRFDWSVRPLTHVFDEAFAAIGRRSAACDAMLGVQGPRNPARSQAAHPFDLLKIPVLHSVGWFDNVAPFSLEDYERIIARREQRPLQYLVGDAVDHEMYHLRHAPIEEADDHNTNASALERLIPECLSPGLDFCDVFVKGKGDAAIVPRARWFLGNVGWRTSPAWPPTQSRELRLYLGSPEKATASIDGGALLPRPDPVTRVAAWTHDPANLVPSTAEDPFAMLHSWEDERRVQGRDDVLTFTGEPFAEPLDLAGPIGVRLTVGSTCSSMHVYVKLCDVFPDGTARMLVRGESLVRQEDYGQPIDVGMSHTAYRLQPGHRLRISVASSDYPLYLWHPGTNENPWIATKGVANEQTLTTGGVSPSFVEVTIV